MLGLGGCTFVSDLALRLSPQTSGDLSLAYPVKYKNLTGLALSITAPSSQITPLLFSPKFKLEEKSPGTTTLMILLLGAGEIDGHGLAQDALVLAPAYYETTKHQTTLKGWVVLNSFQNSSHMAASKKNDFGFPSQLGKFEISESMESLRFKLSAGGASLLQGEVKKVRTKKERFNFYLFSQKDGRILINYFFARGQAGFTDFPATEISFGEGLVPGAGLAHKINKKPEWSSFFEQTEAYLFEPDYITKTIINN